VALAPGAIRTIAEDGLRIQFTGEELKSFAITRASDRLRQRIFARLRPAYPRALIALIGMGACGGSQHWARRLQEMGHTVKLMPGKTVKAFVSGNKNDVAD
jgi:transposase